MEFRDRKIIDYIIDMPDDRKVSILTIADATCCEPSEVWGIIEEHRHQFKVIKYMSGKRTVQKRLNATAYFTSIINNHRPTASIYQRKAAWGNTLAIASILIGASVTLFYPELRSYIVSDSKENPASTNASDKATNPSYDPFNIHGSLDSVLNIKSNFPNN